MTEYTGEYPTGDSAVTVPNFEHDIALDLPEQIKEWKKAHPEDPANNDQGEQ